MVTKKVHPYVLIILTFVITILVGTFFLILPISSTSGKSFGFIDSLFSATSAVCVTGLSVMDISKEMTVFGKVIMTILMEIGGLSFLTIAVFFFTIFGAKIGVSNRFLLREALNQNSVKGIVYLVRRIIFTALIIQGIGIIVNMFALHKYYDSNLLNTLGVSIFHCVASFNNAGFDVFGANSMIPYDTDVLLCANTMFLIVFGGIGFVVIDDIIKNLSWKKFKLHTKITLITTVILIFGGMFLIKLSMNNVTWLQSLFTSITSRTAGFTVIDISKVTPATYLVILTLMFIGASPCSTGGGVKTTTMAVLFLAILNFSRGKTTTVYSRKIADSAVIKAFVLVTVAIFIIIIGSFTICFIQPDLGLDRILFEVVSAFTTTGLSMGITPLLNDVSRLVISLIMLCGRLGPLTVIGFLNKNWMNDSKEKIKYVEESVIIG